MALPRTLNFELPQQLQFDNKYAQQILENSKSVVHASTPTITTLDAATASSDFLQRLGASILNSIQLQNLQRSAERVAGPTSVGVAGAAATSVSDQLSMEYAPNQVVLGSSSYNTVDELQKQLEYDKFMNEVWIGVVLTLILISMIFCICSCALYHQFRTWKRNYHSNVSESNAHTPEMDALKLQTDIEDPVPEYTLVSGLPSYEAALELLHKTPQSCLIVYPSIFNVFTKNELLTTPKTTSASSDATQPQQNAELTTPLLSTASSQNLTIPTYEEAVTLTCIDEKPRPKQARKSSFAKVTQTPNETVRTAEDPPSATIVNLEKAPSYEETVLLVKTDKQ